MKKRGKRELKKDEYSGSICCTSECIVTFPFTKETNNFSVLSVSCGQRIRSYRFALTYTYYLKAEHERFPRAYYVKVNEKKIKTKANTASDKEISRKLRETRKKWKWKRRRNKLENLWLLILEIFLYVTARSRCARWSFDLLAVACEQLSMCMWACVSASETKRRRPLYLLTHFSTKETLAWSTQQTNIYNFYRNDLQSPFQILQSARVSFFIFEYIAQRTATDTHI